MRCLRTLPGIPTVALTVALGAALLGSACSYSTSYVPQRADRLALTLDDGDFVLRQGRLAAPLKEAELGDFGRARTSAQAMLACDERSFDHYLLAQDHFEQAQLFDWGSVAALAIGLLALPSFPIMVWAAFALDLVADNQTAIGLAQVIDAMNIHNDQAACADLDAKPSEEDAKAPAEAGRPRPEGLQQPAPGRAGPLEPSSEQSSAQPSKQPTAEPTEPVRPEASAPPLDDAVPAPAEETPAPDEPSMDDAPPTEASDPAEGAP